MYKKPKTIADFEAIGDYSHQCGELIKHLKKHWSGLDDVKPKGYEAFIKDYNDFQGMEEWGDDPTLSKKQKKEFKGFDSSSAGGFGFIDSTALCHVAYSDIGQGYSPIETLIASCVTYGMSIGECYGRKEAGREIYNKIIMDMLNNEKN